MTSRVYPVKITGPHLTLRELTVDDAQNLHRVYGNEQATRLLSFTPRTLDQVRSIIATAIADAAANPRSVYMLAIADAGDHLVGAARLGLGEYESGQIGFRAPAGPVGPWLRHRDGAAPSAGSRSMSLACIGSGVPATLPTRHPQRR